MAYVHDTVPLCFLLLLSLLVTGSHSVRWLGLDLSSYRRRGARYEDAPGFASNTEWCGAVCGDTQRVGWMDSPVG